MAKKGLVESNLRKEKCVQRFASKRLSLKSIAKNRSISLQDRFAATLKLAELPRNSSSTRLRNRCFFSGRPRAVYAKLGLSRIALREFASSGLIPGFVKSSW